MDFLLDYGNTINPPISNRSHDLRQALIMNEDYMMIPSDMFQQ